MVFRVTSVFSSFNDRANGWLLFIAAFMRPFKIIFKSDSNEVTASMGDAMASELSTFPGGVVVGYQLSFKLVTC
jgi:hypothetical protein